VNKLEERFEEVIWESNPNASMMCDLDSNYLVDGFAKEAKDIAIEFAAYAVDLFKDYWKNPNGNLTYESMFNKFIEEKYGK
jgi:hypothetical protein